MTQNLGLLQHRHSGGILLPEASEQTKAKKAHFFHGVGGRAAFAEKQIDLVGGAERKIAGGVLDAVHCHGATSFPEGRGEESIRERVLSVVLRKN